MWVLRLVELRSRYLTPASVLLQEPSASFLGTVISVVALIGKAVSGEGHWGV